METIGDRVRRLREDKGISRKDLAASAGMSYTGLSDLESGKAKSTTKLHRLAAALGTTPHALETGQDKESQPAELDLEMLKSAIVSVKEALRDIGLELEAFIAAPMIAYAYAERIKLPRTMTKTEYKAFDRMVTERLRGELGDVAEGGSIAETGSRSIEEASSNQAKDGHRRRAG